MTTALDDQVRRYVDPVAAAEYLGLSTRTLEIWRRAGSGPAYHRVSSRCLRYDLTELDRFMADRRRTSTSDPGES